MIDGRYFGAIEMVDRKTGVIDYTVAVEVDHPPATLPDRLVAKTLAGGRFAVFTHTCTGGPVGPGLRETMRYIYGTWVPKSGCKLRAWYDLEVYDHRFRRDTLGGEIDVWVPVK